MSSLAVAVIIFLCVFGGTLLGIVLRAILPEQHLSSESKDVVKLGMGLVASMAALILSLLVASAKSSFDTQRNGIAQLAGSVILLDRVLAHYGIESKDVRAMLRESVADMLQRTWASQHASASSDGTEGRYESLYDKIQQLSPKSDTQRTLQAQSLSMATDIGKLRWAMFTQKGSSIPLPFLVVMVAWLVLLFTSFSLFAPPNPTMVAALLIASLAVSSSLFLILELDRPFDGVIHISSEPLQTALSLLGR